MINKNIRFFDIFFSVFILIFFFPLIILISIWIYLFDGGVIFYRQLRVGYKGKKFLIYKFKTMRDVKLKNENLRVTALGKILRKSSLDELPQFINVLIKDMSIVGPRPLPIKIHKKIPKKIKFKRQKILPGITGVSQINFTGKKRKLSKKIILDMKFVNNYNLLHYFKILFKTPNIILVRIKKNKSSIIS